MYTVLWLKTYLLTFSACFHKILQDFQIPPIVLFPYSLLLLAHCYFLEFISCSIFKNTCYFYIDLSRMKDMFIRINHVLFMLSCHSINTNKHIKIMFFLIFSKLLPCLQLKQGETILGSAIPKEDTDCPHGGNI